MLRASALPVVHGSKSPTDPHSTAQSSAGRDGWSCTKCTMWNDVTNSHCKACRSRKTSRKPTKKTHNTLKKSSGSSGWMCPKCTLWNDATNVNCTACMTRKIGQKIDLKEEQEKLHQLNVVNPSLSIRFKALFSKTPPQWKCPLCTFINSGIYIQCQSCRYLRQDNEDSTSVSDSASSKEESFKTDEQKIKPKKKNGTIHEEPSPSVFDSVKAIFKRSASDAKGATTAKIPQPKEKFEKQKDDIRKVGKQKDEKDAKKSKAGWKCVQCTLINPHTHDKCSACDLARDIDLSAFDRSKKSDTSSQPNVIDKKDRYGGKAGKETHKDKSLTDKSSDHQHQLETGKLTPLSMFEPVSTDSRDHRNLLSSQGGPTWRCEMCAAYNLVSLRQCFICGIGVIPECYIPLTPVVNSPSIPPSQAAAVVSPSPNLQRHDQLQEQEYHHHQKVIVDPLHSKESDYVNLPPLVPQNSDQSSPSHPLTHVNHLHASSSLSPLHITSSNCKVLPHIEQQDPTFANSHLNPQSYAAASLSPERNISPDHRDNSLELSSMYLSSQNGLGLADHFQPYNRDSPLEESEFDPYSRPRTPTDVKKLRRMEQNRRGAEQPIRAYEHHHRRQHSDKGGKTHLMDASVHFNRTKYVSERRNEDVLQANTVYREIQQYCRKNGEPFTDPDFPPADKSLYNNPDHPVTKWKVGKWERPERIRDDFNSGEIEWTVYREPRPEDIAQGVLGNCWVLSALGVVAEQPQLIEDILITKKYSPRVGAYQVRLCRDGKWEVIVIDDCLPCLNTGQLVFSKAHRKQLWVPLIEKALAKLYGSYEALNAGRVLLGLSVLTGLPCEKIHIKKISVKGDAVDMDLIWARLLSFREGGFPMSASCGGDGEGEEEERVYAMLGLESNHAYSILDVKQIGSERLVRLRNPWGKYSWKGSWSDQDARWESHPWLREQLQAVGAEAGVFWMGAHDFFQYFCEVDVCKYRPNWHSLRFEGKFLPYAARQLKTLALEVHTRTEVDISIYQPSTRGRSRHRNLVDMAVLVLCYSNTTGHSSSPYSSPVPISCTLESGSHIQSIVTTNGFLESGRYLILPLAFNHYSHVISYKACEQDEETEDGQRGQFASPQHPSDDGAVPYVVAVFSAQELVYENVTTRPGFLSDSLVLLAEKTGKVTQSFPNMFLYEVYMRHSCRYIVAVNLDKHRHFTVTCDGLESVNVICSRGELYTEDCIPPRHRQVLWVLTQLESTARYSVMMRITSNCTNLNSQGQWGAQHLPALTSTNTELHIPRLIS